MTLPELPKPPPSGYCPTCGRPTLLQELDPLFQGIKELRVVFAGRPGDALRRAGKKHGAA